MSDDLKEDTLETKRVPVEAMIAAAMVKCEAPTLLKAVVCGKPATEAVVENGEYVPVCGHHAMIARRNHWAVGRLRLDKV